jgi:hypothetical protein
MENVFELLIKKLLEVGFYDLLIFIIALAIFYAILRKIKILGDSPVVNAALAFCIAFLIFGFPVIVGFSLTLPFVTFFTHSFVWILIFFIGMLIASFFYPDLPKFLAEKFTSRTMITIAALIGLATIFISGMIGVIFATPPSEGGGIEMPIDTIAITAGLIIFIILLIVAGSVARSK